MAGDGKGHNGTNGKGRSENDRGKALGITTANDVCCCCPSTIAASNAVVAAYPTTVAIVGFNTSDWHPLTASCVAGSGSNFDGTLTKFLYPGSLVAWGKTSGQNNLNGGDSGQIILRWAGIRGCWVLYFVCTGPGGTQPSWWIGYHDGPNPLGRFWVSSYFGRDLSGISPPFVDVA